MANYVLGESGRLHLKVGRGRGGRDASSGTWDAGTRDVGSGDVTSGTLKKRTDVLKNEFQKKNSSIYSVFA